jgi:2-isopropylmalate synthase
MKIKIFDTTIRDGEQAPGCSMNLSEKIEVAKRLETLGVDIIEAGFPVSSRADFEGIKAMAAIIKNCLSRFFTVALKKTLTLLRMCL